MRRCNIEQEFEPILTICAHRDGQLLSLATLDRETTINLQAVAEKFGRSLSTVIARALYTVTESNIYEAEEPFEKFMDIPD